MTQFDFKLRHHQNAIFAINIVHSVTSLPLNLLPILIGWDLIDEQRMVKTLLLEKSVQLQCKNL